MNVAMRLLMSSGTRAPQDRLVRVNQVRATTGSSTTLNFVEGTPLDSTHLLVAVVRWNATGALTATGWTAAGGGGAHGGSAAQTQMYSRQGNGSVNGITVSGASVIRHVHLMAFSGYVSDVPLVSTGTADASAPYDATLASTPAAYGVCVATVSPFSGGAPSAYSNGYSLCGSLPTSGAIWPARKEYLRPSDGTTTATTAAAGTSRTIISLYQLTP